MEEMRGTVESGEMLMLHVCTGLIILINVYYYLINISSIYLCILSLSPTCTFSKQLAQKLLHTAFKELCVAPVIVTLHFMNSYKTKIVMSFSFCCREKE